MSDYFQRLTISRQRLQARHAAGFCDCLLPATDDCLFIKDPADFNEDDDDEQQANNSGDEEWSPLVEWLARPETGVYTFESLLPPVLRYLQEKENSKPQARLLTLQDIRASDVVFYFNYIWNRD